MITIDATLTVPDIVRAAVHQRIKVLQAEAERAETEAKEAAAAARDHDSDLSEYLSGIAYPCEVPASIKPLMDGLYSVGVYAYVTWSWAGVPAGELPKVITVTMECSKAARDGNCLLGLRHGSEIAVKLGPVSDETARLFREDRELALRASALEVKAREARKAAERKDLAREMEGEMLSSLIAAQSPEIAAKIEALASGGRLLPVAS